MRDGQIMAESEPCALINFYGMSVCTVYMHQSVSHCTYISQDYTIIVLVLVLLHCTIYTSFSDIADIGRALV